LFFFPLEGEAKPGIYFYHLLTDRTAVLYTLEDVSTSLSRYVDCTEYYPTESDFSF